MEQQILCPTPADPAAPRPKENDQAVMEAAVERMLPKIITWEGESRNFRDSIDDEERQEIREQVIDALTHAHNELDGYSLARYLDNRHGWSPDEQLVEILGGVYSHIDVAYRAATSQWLKATGRQPKHTVGDQVTVKVTPHQGPANRKPVEHPGTIISNHWDTGRYVVSIPALGHAKPGQPGTQGRFFTWEEIDG